MRRGSLPCLLIVLFVVLGTRPAHAAASLPVLTGKAAVLMDASSGQVLYEAAANERVYPASTTKLLTALLAAETKQPGATVTASAHAFGVEGTSCYLQAGEKHSLEDLTACLMVASGNDAAVAISEHLSGSIEEFATLMNRRATEAGATHSNFANPHGLHDRNHYTTALDLARIGRAALNNPDVFRWASMPKSFLVGPEKLREFLNHNVLLFDVPGSAGKIGFTEEAGHTIIHMAEKDGKRLLVVLAGYNHQGWMFQHAEDLLFWGFENFETRPLVAAGQVVQTLPVTGGDAPQVEVAAQTATQLLSPLGAGGSAPAVQLQYHLPDHLTAPVIQGQVLGELVVTQSGLPFARVSLIANTAVAATSLPKTVLRGSLQLGKWALAICGSAFALAIVIRTWNLRRRHRFRRGHIAGMHRRPSGRKPWR